MLPERYINRLRKSIKQSNPDIWHDRFLNCSKRILSSVLFRFSSKSTYDKTGNILLPLVGYYYSIYHMGVALLCVDYSTPIKDTTMIQHRRLQNLLNSKLIERGILNSEYINLLSDLKIVREYANYNVGSNIIWNDELRKISNINTIDQRIDVALLDAIRIIKFIENEVYKIYDIAPINTIIGDGIGDDIFQSYLSKEDEECVTNFLLENSLTT